VDLVLPRTDAGAIAQAIAGATIYSGLLIVVRRNRDLMWFVGGLAALTIAWFALRMSPGQLRRLRPHPLTAHRQGRPLDLRLGPARRGRSGVTRQVVAAVRADGHRRGMADLTAQPTISDPGLEQVQPLLLATRLRKVLRVNAAVSGLSGFAAALASGWIAEVMGVSTIVVRVVGVGLVLFAIGVGFASGSRQRRLPGLARLIGVADACWVTATAVLVATGALGDAGIGVAVCVGVVVAGFSVFELRGAAAVVSAPLVADLSPSLEAITIAAEVDASAERAWAVVTDHELYGRLAPNLGRVDLTTTNGPELARRCTDNRGRGWSESCTLWDEGRRFAVAVDTSDYPYPLRTMRGSWSVDRLGPARSRLGMTFLFQPRPGLRGRIFVWAMHAAFPVVLRRILRGWNDLS
jgi:hypothetical protein